MDTGEFAGEHVWVHQCVVLALRDPTRACREFCQIEVLQHVNSGTCRCEILGFGKVSFGLLKPLYPRENWLSGQNTVQREIGSIKRKGNILRGSQRNRDKQTDTFICLHCRNCPS